MAQNELSLGAAPANAMRPRSAPPVKQLAGKVICSIDPGSIKMGFSFIRILCDAPVFPHHFKVLSAGMIQVKPSQAYEQRLKIIAGALDQLLGEHETEFLVMERAFAGVNPATAIKLGEVRGIVMGIAIRHGIELSELTPAAVKKEVTGNGRATKEEVETALKALLNFRRGRLTHDATDAVAIGLTFGLRLRVRSGTSTRV